MLFDVNAWVGSWPFRSLRDNTPESLQERMRRSDIRMAAVSRIEAMFHRNPQPANEELAGIVGEFTDSFIGVATINPLFPGWKTDLEKCLDSLDMRGIRVIPQYQGYAEDGDEMHELFSTCAERNVPILIPHRIEDIRQRNWLDPGKMVDLNRIADLIARYPTVTVIITNARPVRTTALWQRIELRDRNWYFDLSLAEVHYQLHRSAEHMSDLSEFIEEGGAPHLLFGSHIPFSYTGPARVKLAVLPVDDTTREQIGWHRGAKIFGIGRPE